jgi:hypothetical protein
MPKWESGDKGQTQEGRFQLAATLHQAKQLLDIKLSNYTFTWTPEASGYQRSKYSKMTLVELDQEECFRNDFSTRRKDGGLFGMMICIGTLPGTNNCSPCMVYYSSGEMLQGSTLLV